MGLLSWWKARYGQQVVPSPGALPSPVGNAGVAQPITYVSPAAPSRTPAPAPPTAARRAKAVQPAWCELCDLDRRFCMHGLEDRRAHDHVYATRLGTNYHLRQDCNALTVPRALSLDAGGGRSRLSSLSRCSARQRGLDPCRICAGGAASGRRK